MDGENSRRKFNGWASYETWVVRDRLDDRYWAEQARRRHGREDAVYSLGMQLRQELSEASPADGSTVYGDLLNAALAEVDCLEIAQSYLDEVDGAAAESRRGDITPDEGDAGGMAEVDGAGGTCESSGAR